MEEVFPKALHLSLYPPLEEEVEESGHSAEWRQE